MNFFLVLVIVLLFCIGCGKQQDDQLKLEEETGYSITDFTGETLELLDYHIVTNYAYGRKTTGLWIDNISSPNSFSQDGAYEGEPIDQQLFDWEHYTVNFPASTNYSIIRSWTVFPVEGGKINRDTPIQQNIIFRSIKLKGVMRMAQEDMTGDFYSWQEKQGDIYFYPYPDEMGNFPIIDLGTWGSEWMKIAGEKTDYCAVADTVKIYLGNINDLQSREDFAKEAGEAIFSNSDLVEVDIALGNVEFGYIEESPVLGKAQYINQIKKIKDL